MQVCWHFWLCRQTLLQINLAGYIFLLKWKITTRRLLNLQSLEALLFWALDCTGQMTCRLSTFPESFAAQRSTSLLRSRRAVTAVKLMWNCLLLSAWTEHSGSAAAGREKTSQDLTETLPDTMMIRIAAFLALLVVACTGKLASQKAVSELYLY